LYLSYAALAASSSPMQVLIIFQEKKEGTVREEISVE
jgi:hypothetical protein